MKPLILGCIADDVTGATDLGATLSGGGMDVVQLLGLPTAEDADIQADALVVALKIRTAPQADAIEQALTAGRWLLDRGAHRLFFKYCSTFDSTDKGNIGPVAEALLDLVGEDLTIICPAYPENQRTVYHGHLFVGERLLSESGMRDHPLTPMTDPDLVRVLGRQVRRPDSVRLASLSIVDAGPDELRAHLDDLRESGARFVVTDAAVSRHLETIASASECCRLMTGGSGVARGLPPLFRRAKLLPEQSHRAPFPSAPGPTAVLSGSCSQATRGQVAAMSSRHPAIVLDPVALANGRQTAEDVVLQMRSLLQSGPALVFSTAAPEDVSKVQATLGRDHAGAILEEAFGRIARGLVDAGIRRLIVAGGETSGRVAQTLGIRRLRIGPDIAPGVPWTASLASPTLQLAFKSGNFGGEDFFLKAMEVAE